MNPSEIFSGNGSTTRSAFKSPLSCFPGKLDGWPDEDDLGIIDWTPSEPDEVITEFTRLLRGPTGDGASKRRSGEKVSWKVDPGHVTAAFRHIGYWADGEQVDKDSGCHPLVHAAWRLMAVAWQEQQDYVKGAN